MTYWQQVERARRKIQSRDEDAGMFTLCDKIDMDKGGQEWVEVVGYNLKNQIKFKGITLKIILNLRVLP